MNKTVIKIITIILLLAMVGSSIAAIIMQFLYHIFLCKGKI